MSQVPRPCNLSPCKTEQLISMAFRYLKHTHLPFFSPTVRKIPVLSGRLSVHRVCAYLALPAEITTLIMDGMRTAFVFKLYCGPPKAD